MKRSSPRRDLIEEFSPVFKKRHSTPLRQYSELSNQNVKEKWRKRWSDFSELVGVKAPCPGFDIHEEVSTQIVQCGKEPPIGEIKKPNKRPEANVSVFDIKQEVDISLANAQGIPSQNTTLQDAIDMKLPETARANGSPFSTPVLVSTYHSPKRRSRSPTPETLIRSLNATTQEDQFQISMFPSQQSQASNANALGHLSIAGPALSQDCHIHLSGDEHGNNTFIENTDENLIVPGELHAEETIFSTKLRLDKGGMADNLLRIYRSRHSELTIWRRRQITSDIGDLNQDTTLITAEILALKIEFNMALLLCRKLPELVPEYKRNLAATSNGAEQLTKIFVVINRTILQRQNISLGRRMILYPPHKVLVRKKLPNPVFIAWKFEVD